MRALRQLAASTGTKAHLLDAVIDANEAQIRRAEAMIEASGAKQVGLSASASNPHR